MFVIVINTCNHNINLLQDSGLVPIVELEILLDGDLGMDRTFKVA